MSKKYYVSEEAHQRRLEEDAKDLKLNPSIYKKKFAEWDSERYWLGSKRDHLVCAQFKQEDIPYDTVRTGIVSFFNESKGYGFIKDMQTQESIFVHINALTEPLKENNMVTFETEQGQKGLSAIKVKKK